MSNKRHVIVLYIHSASRLSHLRKLRKLKSEYLITIISAKVPKSFFLEGFCSFSITANTSSEESNIQNILDLLSELPKPDGIINLSEPFLPVHSILAEKLGLLGPSNKAVHVGRNKYNMRNFANMLGIPVPRFQEITRGEFYKTEVLTYPVILKPLIGSGSTLVERFDSFEALSAKFQELSKSAKDHYAGDSQFNEIFDKEYPFIAEEIIGGDLLYETKLDVSIGEISVESVYVNGNIHILAIHDKPLPANGPYFEEVGYSTPSRIPQHLYELAEKYVSKIHRALGDGCFVLHTEFRTFERGLVLLEFGVRMGGAAIYNSLLASTGIDFIKVQIDIVLGQFKLDVNPPPKPTITCFLFPKKQGVIKAIRGEPRLISNPCYIEHQIYDDIGEIAYRAPMAGRSTMHCIFSDDSFNTLENEVIKAVEDFEILVE